MTLRIVPPQRRAPGTFEAFCHRQYMRLSVKWNGVVAKRIKRSKQRAEDGPETLVRSR